VLVIPFNSAKEHKMNGQIILLLTILGISLVLFAFEWVAADVVALGVLLSLILSGLLPTKKAFAGFGSDTFILILGLLILTASLLRTGVVELTGRVILRRTNTDPNGLLIIIMVASAGLGAFMSNTASTAFFVPVVLGIAQRTKIDPSKLLLPLAFASILTSSVTLVSTSTNLVVSGLITQSRYNLAPIGMFELTPVGLPIAVVGLLYMYFIGRRLIPDRAVSNGSNGLSGNYPYLAEVIVLSESRLVGKTLAESGLGSDLDLTVLRIVRNKTRYIAPRTNTVLEGGDILLVEGWRDDLLKIKDRAGVEFKADAKFTDLANPDEQIEVLEALILPGSPLIGRTLRGFQLRERFGVQVLAINRSGESLRRKLSEVSLKLGDVLLLQGQPEELSSLEGSNIFRVLGKIRNERPNWGRAPIAIAIFGGVLLVGSVGLMPMPVAVLLGALLVFLTRCITPEEAYREVEWKALILIGSMLALGAAMQNTGTAEFLADVIVNTVGQAEPFWILTGFFILTVVLTQPMSNQAAAVVVIPVALQTAVTLGLNPRAFAMTIALAASCSYLTPLEPSCLMVYGPGHYKFADFLRVGAPLTLIIYAITIVMVPLVWPLHL